MNALPPDDLGACGDCRFFVIAHIPAVESDYPLGGPVIGECRRFPPIHRSKIKGPDVDTANFPFVSDDDWCGMWKQRRVDETSSS